MIAAFLLAFGFSATAPADLDRFPGWGVCFEQAGRCDDYLLRLRVLRDVRGYGSDGCYHRAVAGLEFEQRYWKQLDWCCHLSCCPDEGSLTDALTELKRWLGPERYLHGWRPFLLPAYNCPGLPEPRPVPPVFPAGDS